MEINKISPQAPTVEQIEQLRNCIFTYDEVQKAGLQQMFHQYVGQKMIVNYKTVLKQRVRVRGVGIMKFKAKYGIPKSVELYTFVRDKETSAYKMLEELFRKRTEWIRLVDNVDCDRTDRVIEDSVRAAERRKTKNIEKQIEDEVSWLKGRKVETKLTQPFICGECGGTNYKLMNGQKVCPNCGVGFHVQTSGPGPRAIKRPKRKFRRVEYLNGKVLVVSKEGTLVEPVVHKGVMDIQDHDGWLSGKGVM